MGIPSFYQGVFKAGSSMCCFAAMPRPYSPLLTQAGPLLGQGYNSPFFRCRYIAWLETGPLKSHLLRTSKFVFPWIGICQGYTIN